MVAVAALLHPVEPFVYPRASEVLALLVAEALDGELTGMVSAALVNQLTGKPPIAPPATAVLSALKLTVAIPEPATPSQTARVWFLYDRSWIHHQSHSIGSHGTASARK